MKIRDIEVKNWFVGDWPLQLYHIHNPTTNISIYKRDISHLLAEIEPLVGKSIETQISGEPKLIDTKLKMELSDYPLIVNDIVSLLDFFEKIAKAKSFKVLLATISTNMCKRFHTDHNNLRLLCTYNGPGTLWLRDNNVNREALDSFEDNKRIVVDENRIEQVQTGSIAILKGAIYPINGTNAIVHRSPEIEEAGEKRLLLRIDTN